MAIINKQECVVYVNQSGRKEVALVDNRGIRIRLGRLIINGWEPKEWNFAEAVELLPNTGDKL